MALHIYLQAGDTPYSEEGAYTKPISNSIDGVAGGSIIKQYYIRNDNSNFYYTNIQLKFNDGGDNIVDGEDDTEGFGFKLYAADTQPNSQQWGLVTYGNTINIDDIGGAGDGDTTTYRSFWAKIDVPVNSSAAAYQNVDLQILFTENAV